VILSNPKHEAVALAYLADPEKIGRRAYQSVYPKATDAAADVAFSRLLKNAKFVERIAELAERAADGAVMSQREVLELLTIIARANMADYVGTDDITTPIQKLTREQAIAVQERTVEYYTEGQGDDARGVKRVKFKLPDKLRALELLGKHYALFTERHVHELGGVAGRLAAALARVAEGRGEAPLHHDAPKQLLPAPRRKKKAPRRAEVTAATTAKGIVASARRSHKGKRPTVAAGAVKSGQIGRSG
jgi:phage terminase small subunit